MELKSSETVCTYLNLPMTPTCLPLLNLAGVGILLGAFSGLPGAAETKSITSRPSPEKAFRLFVGIDVKVMHDEEFVTVTDFVNQRAHLDTKRSPEMPLHLLQNIKFVHATKLSRNPISIGDIETEFAWGTEADAGDWMRQQAALQGYGADQIDLLNQSVANAVGKPSGVETLPDGSTIDHGDPLGDALNAQQAFTTQNSQLMNSDFYADRVQGQEGGGHNALIIETTISSPVPIASAYLVGVTRVRTDLEGVNDVVFFREIGSLGPDPRNIRIRQDDMPRGFEVQKIDLHVYREGQELVSDQSEKQFALTRDEALEYLTLDRISSRRGETLPAEPAWALAPAALFASDRPRDFDFPLSVHVDAKGRVTKVDESVVVPGQIADVVSDLMFLPAIENGMAVDSIAQINLSDFFR